MIGDRLDDDAKANLKTIQERDSMP